MILITFECWYAYLGREMTLDDTDSIFKKDYNKKDRKHFTSRIFTSRLFYSKAIALNSLSTTHSLSNSARFKHLGIALSIFYLLYNLTAVYSVSLYQVFPAQIHNLAIPFDDVIPFIPVMIVPYSWSLILFVASFFLVRTAAQLSLLTRRLVLATVFACLIFYCYPARFSFHRLVPDDWTQFGYQFLQLVDKPFNQLPSLHVSYAILLGVSLWDVIASKKIWVLSSYRLLLISICTLIIVSTVLTYQHHLLDILGGVVLAGVVLILSNIIRNALVTKYLALGIIGFLLIAIAGFYLANISTIPLAKIDSIENIAIAIALYWLVSFMVLAWAYQQPKYARGKHWFQKNSSGKLTFSTWIKFAPIIIIYNVMSLAGQWYYQLFQKEYRAAIKPYAINDTVFVVATPKLIKTNLESYLTYWLFHTTSLELSKQPAPLLPVARYQIIVVDLAAEISSHSSKLEIASESIVNTHLNAISTSVSPISASPVSTVPGFHFHYLYLPLLDLQPLSEIAFKDYIDLFEQIDALAKSTATQYIMSNWKRELRNNPNEITLINFHCVMGLSRSIGVQVLYLLYCGKLTVYSYLCWIEQHYPHAQLAEAYLPKSLVEAVASYRDNHINHRISSSENEAVNIEK